MMDLLKLDGNNQLCLIMWLKQHFDTNVSPAIRVFSKMVNGVLIILTNPVNERGERMKDSVRESFSYFGMFWKMFRFKKEVEPEYVSFGSHKDQYFLYYEPETVKSDKVIVWIHGGGWNAGNPKFFDFVGQAMAHEGYRTVSIGYRLSPKNKYPCQIEDVCAGYKAAVSYLQGKGIETSRIIISGPSAGAHLSSILCYSKAVQERYGVDLTGVIGYVGWGGPYCFKYCENWTVRTLLGQLFEEEYDRKSAEPVSLMAHNGIPMLLIQSKHDGLIDYACAEEFARQSEVKGNPCELYEVTDKKNTHSWYTAGMFLEGRGKTKHLDKFYSWVEAL